MSKFTDLLNDPKAEKRFLAIFEPYDPLLGGTRALCLSSHGFTTGATETPPSTHFSPRLKKAYSFNRTLYSQGKLSGRTVPGYGDITINNEDGKLDNWVYYSWNGFRCRIYLGGIGFTFSEYGKIFEGTCAPLAWNKSEITVPLRTLEYIFDRSVQTNVFAGTGGIEGSADLANRIKPLGYGIIRNAEPVYLGIISGRHAFAVGSPDSGGITHVKAVYDRGVPLTFVAASPAAGQYTFNRAQGVIYLGGSFNGPIRTDFIGAPVDAITPLSAPAFVTSGPTTCIVPGSANLYTGMRVHIAISEGNWMSGQIAGYLPAGSNYQMTVIVDESSAVGSGGASWIIRPWGTPRGVFNAMAVRMGVGTVAGSLIDATSFADLEGSISGFNAASEMGYWMPDGRNGLEAMDDVANGTGSYWGFNRAGKFNTGRLRQIGGFQPSQAALPTVFLNDTNMISLDRLVTEEPYYSITIRGRRNWAPMTTSDLAASVTTGTQFTEEYLAKGMSGSPAPPVFRPLSKAIVLDYLVDNAAFITTELNRATFMFGGYRDYFAIDAKTQPFALDIGATVNVKTARYALASGKNLFVVDLKETLDGSEFKTALGVWG